MDCKLAKGLSSEQLAEIEKKAQGISTGGPIHFGGSGASAASVPPPPSGTDGQKFDQVRKCRNTSFSSCVLNVGV